MPRFTITVDTDAVDQANAVEAWLDRWQDTAEHVSDNLGCGCCVSIYHVEASQEALAELPNDVVSLGEWTKWCAVFQVVDRREP
ncbi:hypothetical protein [Kushneria avicenniae]|uniref:hypothetical protein n=1 Tax=Kushneria avicenniae TaxID=402385 RepID=UPI000B7C6DC7|nr:hypothetical protein [Kushneria avicenniae]